MTNEGSSHCPGQRESATVKAARQTNRTALVYCGITFLLSWSAWVLAANHPDFILNISILTLNFTLTYHYVLALMGNVVPGLVAVAMLLVTGGGLGRLLVQLHFPRRSKCLFLFALLAPVAFNLLLLVAEGSWLEVSRIRFTTFLQTFLLNMFLAPLWEEIGWRGYLLPTLLRTNSAASVAVIIGLVWGVWHGVLYFLVLQASLLSFLLNFVGIVALSVILTTLYLASGKNLVLPVLFHVSWNTGLSSVNEVGPTLHAHSLIVQTLVLWLVAGTIWFFYREEIKT
jgi:uncharacterized protein